MALGAPLLVLLLALIAAFAVTQWPPDALLARLTGAPGGGSSSSGSSSSVPSSGGKQQQHRQQQRGRRRQRRRERGVGGWPTPAASSQRAASGARCTARWVLPYWTASLNAAGARPAATAAVPVVLPCTHLLPPAPRLQGQEPPFWGVRQYQYWDEAGAGVDGAAAGGVRGGGRGRPAQGAVAQRLAPQRRRLQRQVLHLRQPVVGVVLCGGWWVAPCPRRRLTGRGASPLRAPAALPCRFNNGRFYLLVDGDEPIVSARPPGLPAALPLLACTAAAHPLRARSGLHRPLALSHPVACPVCVCAGAVEADPQPGAQHHARAQRVRVCGVGAPRRGARRHARLRLCLLPAPGGWVGVGVGAVEQGRLRGCGGMAGGAQQRSRPRPFALARPVTCPAAAVADRDRALV